MEHKIIHFLYCPFTGLGLYNGFRGQRWLKNRKKIFWDFVISSLKAQTNKDFILWISWRYEDMHNPIVKELKEWLSYLNIRFIFTYSGVCFYDDKYPDEIARERLISSIHGSMGELLNVMGEAKEVYMTIQPSDDCYHKNAVEGIQRIFNDMPHLQAVGFSKGYICNYTTKEVRNYTPTTNPPFYTIRFPREIFIDPKRHIDYTALKTDVGKYKAGTPLPSHEYVKDCLKYGIINERGFVVGCHFDNISTGFNNPYAGEKVDNIVLKDFGLSEVEPLKIKFSLRKRILKMLPHKVQRKIRYIFGEIIWQRVYNFLRG